MKIFRIVQLPESKRSQLVWELTLLFINSKGVKQTKIENFSIKIVMCNTHVKVVLFDHFFIKVKQMCIVDKRNT